MAKKHRKQNKGSSQKRVRLSQCMIVKNEERNIESGLAWGRGIVHEQIVVDTGSTDRTVEIAKALGAKVYHFEWINDFAAAKNFAIEQASGDWIAFLDADEYFPTDDAIKLLPILNEIMLTPSMRDKCLGVCCPMHQLNDEGKTVDVDVTARLFRNTPRIRYTGRIHEQLNIGAVDTLRTEDIKIMHTGYTETAYTSSGKSKRNMEMIRAELEASTGEIDKQRMKLYLANALISHSNAKGVSDNEKEKVREEAEALYMDVASSSVPVADEYKLTAYRYLLSQCIARPEIISRYEQIADNAIRDYPEDHKITVFYAGILGKEGKHQEAFDMLKKLEARQENPATRSFGYSTPDMLIMCQQLVYAAQALGDIDSVFKYTAAILMVDKKNSGILGIYLKIILRLVPNIDGALELAGMMYDLSNPEEAAFVAAAARDQGAEELAAKIEAAK